MKRLCIGLVCCLQFLMLSGQSLPVGSGTIRWIDPQTAGFPVVQGQAWSQEMTGNYCRLPENMRSEVRPMVWTLACHSAGLSIWFRSNAAPIRVRYAVTHNDERAMPHMPATGVSGLDLYAVDQNGWERYVPGNSTGRSRIPSMPCSNRNRIAILLGKDMSFGCTFLCITECLSWK